MQRVNWGHKQRIEQGTLQRSLPSSPSALFPLRICPNANISISSFVAKDCSLQGLFVAVGTRSLRGSLWLGAGRTQPRAEMGERLSTCLCQALKQATGVQLTQSPFPRSTRAGARAVCPIQCGQLAHEKQGLGLPQPRGRGHGELPSQTSSTWWQGSQHRQPSQWEGQPQVLLLAAP